MAAYASLVSLNFMIEQIQHSGLKSKPHLEPLQKKITFLQQFLENKSRKSNQEVEELERMIVDAGYEAEDLIESNVLDQVLVKSRKQRKMSSKYFVEHLQKVMEKLHSVEKKAKEMMDVQTVTETQVSGWSSTPGGQSGFAPTMDNSMVGFEEHMDKILDRMLSLDSSLQIQPITGMGGIGKTTLTRNVYDNQSIKDRFVIRLWSTISQSYDMHYIIERFLIDLGVVCEPNTESVDNLYKTLFGRSYLIVIDDIWDDKPWIDIKRFFPDNGNGSRIIVTTRNSDLACNIGSCEPYKLDFLDEAQSWRMLNQKVHCPPSLESVGRQIATGCKGLPLAIVVIGGLLAKPGTSWKSVAGALSSFANSEDDQYCLKVLSLSYDYLPVHLKSCLLYMGVYLEDTEVPVSSLVKRWVAEGFLKPDTDKFLEDSAVEYLRDLVERNLLISKTGFTGKIKSCRIHDLLRDLCLRKAQEQNFLYARRFYSLYFPPSKETKPHKNIYRDRDEGHDASILHPSRSTTLQLSSLNLLSKLDAVDVCREEEKQKEKNQLLIGSRCLTLLADDNSALSVSLSSLPMLWDLQSIVMSQIPGNKPIVLPYQIWEMPLLRHIEIPILVLRYPSKNRAFFFKRTHCRLKNMQTLLNVHNFKFSDDVLSRIPNIKKLKVTYTKQCKGAEWQFDMLQKLESLCFSVHEKISVAHISFPQSLKKLALEGTEIPWGDIKMVGSLPNLEVLQLQNDAFYGIEWKPEEKQFCQLKSLHLRKMSLERWEAERIHFPRLKRLVFADIWEMKEIPLNIGDIETLELISFEFCNKSLVDSAERLKEEQEDMDHIIKVEDRLTCGARDKLTEKLEKDLQLFKAFFQKTSMRWRNDKKLRELARGMRKAIDEYEDILDISLVTDAAGNMGSKEYFAKLYEIAKEVDNICSLAQLDPKSLTVADGGPEENEVPVDRQVIIVGLENQTDVLIGYLKEEKDQLDVISIIGIAGHGKTTLAGKIFQDPIIQKEFSTRIWVQISQEFTMQNAFLVILKAFIQITDDIKKKNDLELAQEVAKYLLDRKFLIVMDDVRTPQVWDKLVIALPLKNKMGKVLITSRHMEVGKHVKSNRAPHDMCLLTQDESLLLFQYNVFGKPEFPPGFDVYGSRIVNRCNRVPLAILLVGGLLAKKVYPTEDLAAMRNSWKKLSEDMNAFAEDPIKGMEKIIALSFDKLPYHLRACFLHLGMFPVDFEIPAWKLICMWMGEGFVQERDGMKSEETAENYLDALISRNLVKVDKRSQNGKVKTCRIHEMVHTFCKSEAGREEECFLQEMKGSGAGNINPSIGDMKKFRRVCVHSNAMNFFLSKPRGPRIRAFFSFSNEKIKLSAENSSTIPAAFEVIRVLEINPFTFTNIPNNMSRLFHLRYLALSLDLAALPREFSKLDNMQTLIVDTVLPTLEIKADIWKMKQLRHVKTNASTVLTNPESGSAAIEGNNIQTLGTVSPKSCTDGFFGRALFVKNLGIRGKLSLLLDGRKESVYGFEKLKNLQKLKLINEIYPGSTSEDTPQGLPSAYQFPPQLRSLTLVATFLEWTQMSTIELLENLEVLKLKDRAFVGNAWLPVDDSFPKLEALYIDNMDFIIWIADKHHFPRLRSLELMNCDDLHEIPIEMADIPSFQMLKLYHPNNSVAASAQLIHVAKEKMQEDETTKSVGFKLSTSSW